MSRPDPCALTHPEGNTEFPFAGSDCSIMRIMVLMIILLSIGACGGSRVDLSTPEKCVDSLYYAISKKDAELYSRCF